MGEEDILLPPVVHGPLLISFADLNGFEFGTKVRNPYQKLFERKPDAVIANGVAVFNGDFSLPEAAALAYEQQAADALEKNPHAALIAARQAVTLVPDGFDANLRLGDALATLGDQAGARMAYAVAMRRVADMEPSAQEHWQPEVARKLAAVGSRN